MSLFATPKDTTSSKISYADLISKVNEQERLINILIAARDVDKNVFKNLNKRITDLEAYQIKLESVMFIKDHVSGLLIKRISDLEQRSRRYCVNIKGVKVEPNENLVEKVHNLVGECDSAVTLNDIDKFHRDGEKNGDKQDIILRFKSHSAKEAFYKARATIPRVQERKIKVQPSLSAERKKLLSEASELISSYQKRPDRPDHPVHHGPNDQPDRPDQPDHPKAYPNPPHFALADVHGNLMVKLSSRTKDGLFFHFDSIEQLSQIIYKYNAVEPVEMADAISEFDKEMDKYDN